MFTVKFDDVWNTELMVMSTMKTDDVWNQESIFYIYFYNYVMVILDFVVLDMCEDDLQSFLSYLTELLSLYARTVRQFTLS